MPDKSKRGLTLGTRLNDEEAERWNRLIQVVKQQLDKLLDDSKVLRDLLFADLNLVTDADRKALQHPKMELVGASKTGKTVKNEQKEPRRSSKATR